MPRDQKNAPLSWQDALRSFAAANPDMPAGDDIQPQEEFCNAPSSPVGRLDIEYQKKGRAGKPVTIISGFDPSVSDPEIETLASGMKRSMGCGGSCRGGEILLQGDRRPSALDFLTKAGYKARII